jgi:anti-sigma regulatory factor (Ser/Thr protein kinase)/ActR/RegA family two-component response regulator
MSEADVERREYGRPSRVLVCGDDEQIAQRVAHVLSDSIVERCGDDEAVLAAMQSRPIDLLLTDRKRTAKEAVVLLHRIEHNHSTPKPRVIILTTESFREDAIAAMRAGAFSLFSKPYFEAAFDEILRHAASGVEWEDSIRVDSATPAWLRIIARCELATADRAIQFLNEVSDLAGKERESMGFALKEILMNAMEYGGKFNRDRWVEVSYVRGQRMILYRIRDPGEGFSLEELTHSAISNPPEEPVRHLEVRESMGIRPGGYGVLLSRKLVDDLIYNEQGNDVLLIKYLDWIAPDNPVARGSV